MADNSFCKWVIRPGTNNSFWAHTPCKHGYNPLTKVKRVSDIEDTYNGRSCPICGRPIHIDLSLMSKEVYEI